MLQVSMKVYEENCLLFIALNSSTLLSYNSHLTYLTSPHPLQKYIQISLAWRVAEASLNTTTHTKTLSTRPENLKIYSETQLSLNSLKPARNKISMIQTLLKLPIVSRKSSIDVDAWLETVGISIMTILQSSEKPGKKDREKILEINKMMMQNPFICLKPKKPWREIPLLSDNFWIKSLKLMNQLNSLRKNTSIALRCFITGKGMRKEWAVRSK